jgi:hypothetical protein
VVNIKSPIDGQNFAVGNSFDMTLSASDPNGKITRHQVYVNGNLVDTDGSSYTPYRFNKITKGTHTIRAVVTDNNGIKTSQSITVTAGGTSSSSGATSGDSGDSAPTSGNKAPIVSILSPKNGQNYSIGTNVSINLSASDSDGSIAKHQIFVNNSLVDTDGGNYTAHTIKNVRSGSYTIEARVTDNKGARTTEKITFTVGGATSKTASSLAGSASPGTKTTEEAGTELVAETEEAAFVTIAPNPVQEKTLHIYQNGHKYMRIVDLSGSILRKIVVDQRELTLDIGDFKPGIYILISDQESTKFIVE